MHLPFLTTLPAVVQIAEPVLPKKAIILPEISEMLAAAAADDYNNDDSNLFLEGGAEV